MGILNEVYAIFQVLALFVAYGQGQVLYRANFFPCLAPNSASSIQLVYSEAAV